VTELIATTAKNTERKRRKRVGRSKPGIIPGGLIPLRFSASVMKVVRHKLIEDYMNYLLRFSLAGP